MPKATPHEGKISKEKKRTGIACDRCRSRKIKCDGSTTNCQACLNAGVICKTTDRISKRAVPRGYIEELEARLQVAETAFERVRMLEHIIKVECPDLNIAALSANPPDQESDSSSVVAKSPRNQQEEQELAHPNPEWASAQKNYLGRSSRAMFMDSVRHSALTVLGIDFHLSDWDPASQVDSDFVYSGPDIELNDFISRLPPIEVAYFLSETYFSICNPLIAILHKPSHLREIRNMYTNPNYELKYPWLIQYHMVWALSRLMLQIEYVPESLRPAWKTINHRDLYTQVQPHFTKLLVNTDLPCVQAASLMFAYLRGTVRPASYWHIGRLVVSMAYEIGLHRKSDKKCFTLLELELRKRNWWIIFAWDTIISQQMGRPLSVRAADYDQEQPEGFEDDYLEDTSLPPFKSDHPTYTTACFFFRLTVVSNKIMEQLYSVRKPDRTSYVNVVNEIERDLDEYQNQVPPSLKFNIDSRVDNRVLLYQQGLIRLIFLELKILVRHPSLFSNVTSPLFSAASLSICTEASRQLIHTQGHMLRYNALDMTWHSASLCLLATMTILYSIWEKGDCSKSNQVPALETEIKMSMDIMEKIGERWGVAQRFRETVSVLSSATLRRTLRNRPGKSTTQNTSEQNTLRPRRPSSPRYQQGPRESLVSQAPYLAPMQFCPWLLDQQQANVPLVPISNSWYGWDTFVGEIGAAGIDSSVVHVPPAYYNQTPPTVQDHSTFQLSTNQGTYYDN